MKKKLSKKTFVQYSLLAIFVLTGTICAVKELNPLQDQKTNNSFVSQFASSQQVKAETTKSNREVSRSAIKSISTESEKLATSSPIKSATDSVKPQIKPTTQINFSFKVPVLMYHYVRPFSGLTDTVSQHLSVSPEALEEQLIYLRNNGYQTISLNDLFDSLENGTPLPPKSVILTFDDGYRDFYTTAFPIIKKYNVRVVSFFVTGYTQYPNYMTKEMVKEIHSSGLVDVQSHTMGHLDLAQMSLEEAKGQIFDSKTSLENILGKKINYFAYPYGSFNAEISSLVAQAGYKLAFSTVPGTDLSTAEKYSLKRVAITGFDNLESFKAKLHD